MLTPVSAVDRETAKALRGVFFDVDDTITTKGKMPVCSYSALWSLHYHGLKVVPITGRPAGWCDHIARMWPVDAVVGENGAFYFWHDSKTGILKKRFLDPGPVRRQKRLRLEKVRDAILASVPGTQVASDQRYREADLAIDFCEDVPALPWDAVEKICALFKQHGANCKVSSIHVNGWFGDYDKLAMTKLLAQELWQVNLAASKQQYLFCGDSPNDEPMFEFFPISVGVRNVLRFTAHMKRLPAFVTRKNGGEGFAEMVDTLLRLRADSH